MFGVFFFRVMESTWSVGFTLLDRLSNRGSEVASLVISTGTSLRAITSGYPSLTFSFLRFRRFRTPVADILTLAFCYRSDLLFFKLPSQGGFLTTTQLSFVQQDFLSIMRLSLAHRSSGNYHCCLFVSFLVPHPNQTKRQLWGSTEGNKVTSCLGYAWSGLSPFGVTRNVHNARQQRTILRQFSFICDVATASCGAACRFSCSFLPRKRRLTPVLGLIKWNDLNLYRL